MASGAVGAVTGGVGARLAIRAADGAIAATAATAGTAAIGGLANGVGTLASDFASGGETSIADAAVSVGGALSAGIGAKVANKAVAALNRQERMGGMAETIADTTRTSMGRRAGERAEAGVSFTEVTGSSFPEAVVKGTQTIPREERSQ